MPASTSPTSTARQFFYDDEIDVEPFRRKARELDFHEEAYLAALAKMPVVGHEQVDLSDRAPAIADDLRKSDEPRAVEFAVAEGITAHVDRQLTRIVLKNLLGNAWKFSAGHETGRIEVGIVQENGSDIFFVRDGGGGFDLRSADKLFVAFQRLHTPDSFEGTGIGVATVQRIVHRHDGSVRAEAEVEKGATFWFTLGSAGGT